MNNTDTTYYTEEDRAWLKLFADYSRQLAGRGCRPLSWFWWAWNANSGKLQLDFVVLHSAWRLATGAQAETGHDMGHYLMRQREQSRS